MGFFIAHCARRKKILTRRHLAETALLVEICAVYAEARGAYGWPRVWRQLKARGVRVGKRRVERTMRQNGLRGRGKRRFRGCTTDTNHALPVAPNDLLRKRFDLLVSIPGIAQVSAMQLLAELSTMPSNLTVREWVAHSGLDPAHEISGS